jgi:carboxypeptidase family protein
MPTLRILGWLLFTTLLGWGQTTATLHVRITDHTSAAIVGARLTLDTPLTGFHAETLSVADGSATFQNIPLQDYRLTITKSGFAAEARDLSLRTNIPVRLDLTLRLSTVEDSVSVSAFETTDLVDPEATGTRTVMNQGQMERLPVPVSSRGIESYIMSFPGFAANANGAIHPRGAHNQMTFVVDGMPISDQLTGAFATSIDTNIVQTIELYTGNIPAEFGAKISGVASVLTRSGMGTGRRFGGSVTTGVSQFDTATTAAQVYGESGKFGYFASVSGSKSNRFLDQVALQNLHNGGNTERGLIRLDYQASQRDALRFHAMSGRSSFQLANLPSQHANGQQQRQLFRDLSLWAGYVRTLSPAATYDATISYRTSIAQFAPSAGDTPVTASQARHLSTINFAQRVNWIRGAHTFRLGGDVQHFPVSEDFSFGITSPSFNNPASDGYIETLRGVDLSRGGALFRFSEKASGNFYTGFLQDTIRAGRWTFTLGARYDNYRFLVKGNQLQPRVGLSFHLRETGTVFRASYNRNYQTPPNENLLLANTDKAAALVLPDVREQVGGAFLRIQPERQDVVEAGIQQSLGRRMSLNAVYYNKSSTDLQDNDNFFNTGIISPTSLARSRVNGFETRLAVPQWRGFTGSLSATHYRVVATPPFTGGLFLGNAAVEALSAGPFVIDHDQNLSLHGVLSYTSRKGWWASWQMRHDSGLVSNPSDPVVVANDPDFANLLPYVNLESDPPRVRPRTIMDIAGGYEHSREGRRTWEVMFQLTNLTNRTALYNFQSLFVGTRLVQPRSAGVRLRWWF